MTADEPHHPLRDTAPPPPAATPRHPRSAIPRRARLAGALLVIACLLAVAGAVLPWLTAVRVDLNSGSRTELFTWRAWDTFCCLPFLLFAFPLFHLSRAGLDAIRGVAPKLGRRPALLLSLAGCAGVVIFVVLLGLADVVAHFPHLDFGRGQYPPDFVTDTVIGSGFYVSLVGYALATIASLLLPATSSG